LKTGHPRPRARAALSGGWGYSFFAAGVVDGEGEADDDEEEDSEVEDDEDSEDPLDSEPDFPSL